MKLGIEKSMDSDRGGKLKLWREQKITTTVAFALPCAFRIARWQAGYYVIQCREKYPKD